MEEDNDEKTVSWDRKARLRTFPVEEGNRLVPYVRGVRNSPPAPGATTQSTRHRQVLEFEAKYRRGVPCEVREELIAAFNVLGGLRKTIEVHKKVYQAKGIRDKDDAEIESELIDAFRAARTKAFDLLVQCGFPKPLSFGKRLRKIRNILPSEKRKKADAILALLED